MVSPKSRQIKTVYFFDCYNSNTENFYSIFKTECLYLEKSSTIAEAYRLIDNYMYYYNNVRITGNDYTPTEIRQMAMLKSVDM